MTIELKFDLHSYWHVGSGRGRDAVLDAEVVRDADGLPFIPGKTVKGLVRRAVELVALASGGTRPELVEKLFGSEIPGVRTAADGDEQVREIDRGRYDTKPGALWFGSAVLPQAWTTWVRSGARDGGGEGLTRDGVVSALYRTVASTAMDKRGLAKDHTLRVSEVVVPMTLTAEVLADEDALAGVRWASTIEQALPHVRALGVRRRRGYGRCTVTMVRT